MDPGTGFVLYSPQSQRTTIINNWLRLCNTINMTPIAITSLFISFSNNPYQNRLEFGVNEAVGYILPNYNYIFNCIIKQSVIGCRVRLSANNNDNKIFNHPSFNHISINNVPKWIELPDNNIVPPLFLPLTIDKHPNCSDEDNLAEFVMHQTTEPISLKVPRKYAVISCFYNTVVEVYANDPIPIYNQKQVTPFYLALIIKFMYHCKGHGGRFNIRFALLEQYESFEDIVGDDLWFLEFINMVYDSKDKQHGIIGLYVAAAYMDISDLVYLCMLRMMYGFNGKSKEEMIAYFKENDVEFVLNHYYNNEILWSDWIDRWSQ